MLLVTGGAGFLGCAVVHALHRGGRAVRVLDDLSTGRPERLPAGVALMVGDVTDAATVAAALRGVRTVIHLAARRAVTRSVTEPLATDRVNTGGTVAVLDAAAAAGVDRVVCASSSSVYGDAAVLPTPEDAPLLPRSPYAVSKLAGEHYARVLGDLRGLSAVSLRLFNLYGPGQDPAGPHAQLVPRVLRALAAGTRPVVHGDGGQARDLLYVDDAARAVVAAADARVEGPVNIGTGRAHTVLEVVATAAAVLGRPPDVEFTPARPGDVRATQADPARARTTLDWKAEVGLAEGLERTARAPA